MFARVFIVGDTTLGEASFARRIEKALARLGHATYLLPCSPDVADEIHAAHTGFSPTLVFADGTILAMREDVRAALHGLGVPIVSFGSEGAGRFSDVSLPRPLNDKSYQCACGSLPSGERPYALLVPHRVDERVERLLTEIERVGATHVERLFSTRGEPSLDLDLSVGAAKARMSRICLLCDSYDDIGEQDAALRVAEGCLVVVEDRLIQRWGDQVVRNAMVVADSQNMASVIHRLLTDDAEQEKWRSKQQDWLDGLDDLEETLSSIFDEQGAMHSCASMKNAARNVVAFGWLGMENLGDDLLLRVVADRVLDRFPEATIRVIGGNPHRIRVDMGFEAVRASEHYRMHEMIRHADAVVFCGGLVFDDPLAYTPGSVELFSEPYMDPACQAAACLMAWQHGVPAFYLGAGLGPVAKPATREALRYIGLAGARLLLRDQDSVDLALKSGVPSAQVGAYADLVLSAHDTVVERASDDLPDGLLPDRYITVALRDWPLNPAGFEEALAAELDRISEQTGLAVAFVPFDPDDVHIHHRVAERMRAKMVVEIASRLAMPEMLSVVKHSAMAVAMRLHCSILHHVLGKPAIGLDYNEKVGSHFREMGRGAYLIPLDSVAGSLSTAALRASADPEVTRRQIEEGLASLTPKVEEAFQELFSAIEGHEPAPRETEVFYPRARSQAAVDLEASRAREQALSARVTQLQGELDAARARISDLEQSTSYRLGHALVKVPHALFRGR